MSTRAAESVTAVVAAAGSGERLGAGGPKAFVPLRGRPLVEWSIAAFRAAGVGSIVLACPPGHIHDLGGETSPQDVKVVAGGATRAESVANALEAVDAELVAIHDAARPLVTAELIEGLVGALAADPEADGAIAATPVADTIKEARDENQPGDRLVAHARPGVDESPSVVATTVDRSRLWAAQTPQVFRTEALRRALAGYPGDAPPATDEAMLLEAAGGRVLLHPASAQNLKVTTPFDLRLAEVLLAERERGGG
jgi:2-C-methyl-D-erythritol 4-phosphate cytidylyltransferase